jgi:DNA-binding transcriptional MerR regulator
VLADLLLGLIRKDLPRRSENSMNDSSVPSASENGYREIGYRGATACVAAGITYRQLDYWARTGLVEPSIQSAAGSGSQRLYGFRDILVLKIVKRLLDTGVSLQNIRSAVEHLRSRGIEDLERMTLMSDGASIYECNSADDIVDLLQGGQGVFGIAIGKVWTEVEGSLSQLQGENPNSGEMTVTPDALSKDELAERRKRKGA